MGHERIGHLPKSRRWRDVVDMLGDLDASQIDTAAVAGQTIKNVRGRLERMHLDSGVQAAFEFLVQLAVAARHADPRAELRSRGIELPETLTPLTLTRALDTWVSDRRESLEYAQLAVRAGADAMAAWQAEKSGQGVLFSASERDLGPWQQASSGAGFCEVSRLFFASLTERYLKYFLEREASASARSVDERSEFNRGLREHAFETAKITQSFAAGWFNKQTKRGDPKTRAIQAFLSLALGKISEELRREGARL